MPARFTYGTPNSPVMTWTESSHKARVKADAVFTDFLMATGHRPYIRHLATVRPPD
jgi:hypothetical protein